MALMTKKLTIDKAGRIVLPKPLRDELHLAPGDALQMDTDGEKITLRPVRENVPMRKKRGVWVYGVGEPLTASVVEDTLQRVRYERGGPKSWQSWQALI